MAQISTCAYRQFFFFFFFLIWVLRPFQEYFTYIEPIVHRRWAKTGEPRPSNPVTYMSNACIVYVYYKVK